MHIAMLNLTSGGLSGGYRTYLRQLIPLLRKDPRIRSLDVYVPPQAIGLLSDEGFGPLKTWPERDSLYSFRNLKQQLRNSSPDAALIPTSRWIDCGTIPTVIMVRNMAAPTIPFMGNPLSECIKNILRAHNTKKACQKANRVIAVSHFVKDFLERTWNINKKKIDVIYHGIEPPTPWAEGDCPQSLLGIEPGKFLFTAGSILPYRRLEDIIQALSILRDKGSAFKLLIVGLPEPASLGYKRKLVKRIEKERLQKQVRWAGWLDPKEMSWCYLHCSMFIMSSATCRVGRLMPRAKGRGMITYRQTSGPWDVGLLCPDRRAGSLSGAEDGR